MTSAATSSDTARSISDIAPPSVWTKLAYGVGAIAYGVKDNGFNFFLLLFYSQIVGLDARLVGLAILCALVVDAISDPIVGYWSDNLRSRWGRRHPFMYASAIPVALSFYLLWNPPVGWSQQSLFFYLLGLSIVIRTAITLYETPSAALAPDLTSDYEQRSSLIGYRFYFGWTGGNLMTVIMFFLIFPTFTTDLVPSGQFARESYAVYGIIASVMIFAAIMISALGTHSRIKHLNPPPPKRTMTMGRVFKEIFETLSERAFASLFIANLFGAVATGLAGGLTFYFLVYFWGFSSIQQGYITLGTFLAALIGFVLAPIITRTIGKKRGAMIIGLVAFLGAPVPIVLRLLDILPPNGTDFVFWFVFVTNVVDVGLIICFQILVSSMGADLVEQSELKTGRRSEGVFTSAMTFVRKCVQGFGLMAASFVLALANFPKGAAVGEVPQESIWSLGAYYVPAILTLWIAMMVFVSTYSISREDHEENLRKLAEKKVISSGT
jgi:glycoside/pentoside/hexuronide:cation symporter, GPH family